MNQMDKAGDPIPKDFRSRPAIRVLICGSRDWTNDDMILAQIFLLPHESIIIHGDYKTGADAMADYWGRYLLYEVKPYPANWPEYGSQAGPIRNLQMLEEGKPDQVWAFMDRLTDGTGDMVRKAQKASIPVTFFGQYRPEPDPKQLSFFDMVADSIPARRLKL